MKTLALIVFAVILLASVLIAKAVRVLPLAELKRRARGEKKSSTAKIYSVAAYGAELDLLLWVLGAISFTSLLFYASHVGWWLMLVLVIAGGSLVVVWRPGRASGPLWRVAALLALIVAKLLSMLHPLLGRLADWLRRLWPANPHTSTYEKEDLVKLIKAQALQSDNRIAANDLKMAFYALSFGDKTVGQVMTPRRQVKLVAATDAIGPHLMDELHASGFSRLPVVKVLSRSSAPQIIGTLYLKDLAGRASGGSVRGVMKDQVYYINESDNLRDCLAACLKTHHHLLIVVNDFEEISGVITMEDVLEQILGQKIVDEFDHHDNLKAVAGRTAERNNLPHHAKTEPQPTIESAKKTE